MNILPLLIIILALLLCVALIIIVTKESALAKKRLEQLQDAAQNSIFLQTSASIQWNEGEEQLSQLRDRFGKAGFTTKKARRRAKFLGLTMISFPALLLLSLGVALNGIFGGLLGAGIGCYIGLTGYLYFLRYRAQDFSREILFQMPLFLESLILLVESGLGILPALQRIVMDENRSTSENPLKQLFRIAYQFSAHGMPLTKAFETVAESADQRIIRHVLLHLDISGSEGGELIPALRSLSDHAHSEWKLSVEHRVRRLENFVVFPVFAAVIGLMLLTAAVPMVPILNLKNTLELSRTQGISPSWEAQPTSSEGP